VKLTIGSWFPEDKEAAMTQSDQPNIGANLARIHRVVTRSLGVVREESLSFADTGFSDSSMQEGFASYIHCFVSLLQAHHLTEDELLFPYLRDKVPDAPYDLLRAGHDAIAQILPEIEATPAQVKADRQPSGALRDLNHSLIRLVGIWQPHIQKEERHFSVETLARLIEPEEHARVNALLAESSRRHSGPDYLVVPFILYNLSEADRVVMSQDMPLVVIQQLVPGAWKEKWAPMRPFLLA
jgi:hemerythrin-like domain-containing protein